MLSLIRIYLALLVCTAADGGIGTIFSPFLDASHYPVDQIGLIVAVFGVTQLAARIPAGILYGRGRVALLLAGFVVLYIVSTVAFAFPGGTLYILLWTVLHGFAFGGIGTILLAWAIEMNPRRSNQSGSMGWFTAALSGGYSIGYTTGGFVADNWGYPIAFTLLGLIPLLSIALTITLPSPARVQAPTSGKLVKAGPRAWLGMLSPNLMLATLIAFYLNFLDDGFGTFFPLIGLSIGLNLTFIGFLRGLRSFVATGLRPLSGMIFRYLPMRPLNHVLLIAWASAVFFTPDLREPWILIAFFALVGICRGLTRVASATMIAEEKANDPRGVGVASGLYNAGLDVGAFAGPLVGGWIAAATDLLTMFRIAPMALLVVYLLAVMAVSRVQSRRLAQVQVPFSD